MRRIPRSFLLAVLSVVPALSVPGMGHAQTIPNVCLNPDLVASYQKLYGRAITSPECLASHYNGGKRNSRPELEGYIRQYQASLQSSAGRIVAPAGLQPGDLFVASDLSLRDSSLRVLQQPGSYLISNDGGGLVSPTAGIVASGGGNFSLQSVGGKKVYKAKKR